MSDLLTMNGYGLYVWGAYGVAFVILAGLIAQTLLRRRALKKQEDALSP